MPTSTQLATGLGGAVGCDFRTAYNQLIFVEFASGKLSALNLIPAATVVAQSASTVLKGTFTFDFDSGTQGGLLAAADVFWEQETTVLREMTPQNSARLVNLGPVDFNSLAPATLRSLTYGTTPIPGNNNPTNRLTVNDVFAVQTTNGNFAKVQVLHYGYDLTIRWVTYRMNPGYMVLGSGYNQPEDVKLSADGMYAYITERSGDLVRVALSNANRAAATVICSGLTAPQQLFLDQAHNCAYVTEYSAAGDLLKINLTGGAKTVVASGLNFPVGVVLSSDLQSAYVSEQTTGPDQGRVSRIQLGNGAKTTLAHGLVAPFFLTWADDSESALLVPQRDPSNSIVNVNATSGVVSTVVSGVPTRPSSVAVTHPGQMLICSDAVVEKVDFALLSLSGPLLMGIGLIPFDRMNTAPGPTQGMANTSVDANPPFFVKNAPFGGALPIMVNHQAAANAGAAFYQVLVDNVPQTDSWTNYKWNGTSNVLVTTKATTVGLSAGCYPVHPVGELFLWLSPALGDMLDSTVLSNGFHTIVLQFTDAAGHPLPAVRSAPLTILVNNQSCTGTLSAAVISAIPPVAADACGVLHYGSNAGGSLSIPFTASHPANFATVSISLVRGVTSVTLSPPLPSGAPVDTVSSPITAPISSLMGACPTAGFAAQLYVAATMVNGYSRQSQYDAAALMGLVLTP